MESNRSPVSPHLFRRYFYSGWAFFMPYLFFYLLYYWRKWPVNPGSGSHLPPLLHVYWALHIIHLVLGILALRTWWSETKSGFPRFLIFRFSDFLPWLLLALIFYIPGPYLEFPSDPWMHYDRINQWASLLLVGDHPFWFKSSYFFAYSLLGQIPPNHQLFWLDGYYTVCCLLLCWQYFRLARTTGLGERAALLFVLLQVLLFGNSVFSFYRYYGIASTIFSQLGTIALIRLGLDFAKSKSFAIRHSPFVIRHSPPTPGLPVLRSLCAGGCLLAFIAFNHAQGLGMAALGLAAVAVWRLIEWKHSMLWWLSMAALVSSIAVMHWWPHHRSIEHAYQPSGWLTTWDGFKVFSPQSAAGDRMLQILGLLGVINLVGGLALLFRNHVVGWLTVMPVLALCLPVVAIPFAGVLAQRYSSGDGIASFHRMFLAIPAGLALVCLGQEIANRWKHYGGSAVFRIIFYPVGALAFLAMVALPPSAPYYNHFWNALTTPPDDLQMSHAFAGFTGPDRHWLVRNPAPSLLATPAFGYLADVAGIKSISPIGRPLAEPIVDNAYILLRATADAAANHTPTAILIPPSLRLFTPMSFAAYLSGHWMPQAVAMEYAAGPEIEAAAQKSDGRRAEGVAGTYYFIGVSLAK